MRAIQKAREKMAAEVNIMNIVKSRRVFFEALKDLLPQVKYKLFRKRAEYIVIDPDISSDEKDQN